MAVPLANRAQEDGVRITLLEDGRDRLVEAVRAGDLDAAAVFDFPALGLTVDAGAQGRHLVDEAHELLVHPITASPARRRSR